MKKTYKGAGVILKIKEGKREYIVLVKRTLDAPINPNTYSGFFGSAEKIDRNNPFYIAIREFREEFSADILSNKGKGFLALYLHEVARWIEFIDYEGLKRIYYASFTIDYPYRLKNFCLNDGETNNGNLLQREISVFNSTDFKKWWLGEKKEIKATYSYQAGEKIKQATLKDKRQLSPTLLIAFNLLIK